MNSLLKPENVKCLLPIFYAVLVILVIDKTADHTGQSFGGFFSTVEIVVPPAPPRTILTVAMRDQARTASEASKRAEIETEKQMALAAPADKTLNAAKRAAATKKAEMKSRELGMATVSREINEMTRVAAARQTWNTGLILLIVLGLLVALASIWLVYVSVEDVGVGSDRKPSYMPHIGAGGLLFVMVVCVLRFFGPGAGLLHLGLPTPPEAVKMLAATDMMNCAGWVIQLALCAIILSAAASLLYHPDSELLDPSNSDADQKKARDRYLQYLVRSFERARLSVYLAALLLGVAVYHFDTMMRLPLSHLPSDGDVSTSASKTGTASQAELSPNLDFIGKSQSIAKDAATPDTSQSLSASANQYISDLTFGYGLSLSLVLVVILLPVLMVLRKRAWRLARALKPGESATAHQEYLKTNKLTLTFSNQVGQIVALTAPTGAAQLLKTLSDKIPT